MAQIETINKLNAKYVDTDYLRLPTLTNATALGTDENGYVVESTASGTGNVSSTTPVTSGNIPVYADTVGNITDSTHKLSDYEPADATILKDADIGVTIPALSHNHAISDVTDLTTTLSGKAASSHTHAQSDITNLATALSGKSDTNHTHSEYEPADATILKDADIGVSVQAYDSTILNDADIGVSVAAYSHTHDYEPANANIQSHISSTSNPHSVTATQVLPTQTGNNGKVLKTNGTAASWESETGGTLDITALTATTDTPDGANDYLIVYDNSNTANRKINLNSLAKKIKSLYIPAGAFIPSTTNGAAYSTISESATNKQNIAYMDFGKDAIQYAETTLVLPDSYDGGTITAKLYWTATGGSATVVRWGIAGRCYGDNELIDKTWGTAVTVDDTWQADLAVHITDATSAITLAGTPAGGELVQLRIYREGSNAADTLGVSARLLGIKLEYSVNSWSD